jgi:hypothetical protein
MLFRPVRGGLIDAMAEVKEVNSWQDLILALDSYDRDRLAKPNGCLELQYQCWDDRIGWNSYLVVVNGQAAGYMNGLIAEPIQ